MNDTKQRRGFAAMDPEKQRAIASQGGKASHAKGTGHQWTRGAEASAAGKLGGKAKTRRRDVSTPKAGE